MGYHYFKDHYRLIAVALPRQKELDTDSKTIQQKYFVWQLKKLVVNSNATDPGNDQSMFVLTILPEINERRLKIFQGSVTVL